MKENLEFGYWHHFEKTVKLNSAITQVENYDGEENLVIACTQLGTSLKFQNQVIDKWIDLLTTQKLPVKKIWFTSRISDKILNAICHQTQLEGLWIKWGVYSSIENIGKLKDLEYLHLGGGASLKSIGTLTNLKKLKSFEANHLYNISDYSFLSNFTNLIDLSIEGDPLSTMKKVTIKSLSFLEKMPQIVRLNLIMTKIEDRSYLPILKIKELKHLALPNDKDLQKDIKLFEKFGI